MPVTTERLADVFVEVADTLIAGFDLLEFLQLLTMRTAEIVRSDSAGLVLADKANQLRFMAASDETTKLLELFQVQHAEGPCLDCYRRQESVVNADLAEAADRWPAFAPHAVAAGFRSVHAVPLRIRSTVIGALNLFDRETGRLDTADVHVVQALADVATIGLMQARTIRQAEDLAEQLQNALDSRVVLEQAKGAVALYHRSDVAHAFGLIRAYARRNNRRLTEVAQAVIDDPSTISSLTS